MAIIFAALGSEADTAAADPWTPVATFTPTANRLVLLAVANSSNRTMTVTGCGLTWVEIISVAFDTIASPTRRMTLFRAMGATPSSGQITVDFAAAVTGAACSMVEFDGIDTGGTNGSAAIVQAVATPEDTGDATSLVTLAAFGSVDNATYGAFAHARNEDTTPGTGFTEAHDLGHAAPTARLFTEYLLGNDITVDCTWTNTSASGGIAVEIKAAVGGASVFPHHYYQQMRG